MRKEYALALSLIMMAADVEAATPEGITTAPTGAQRRDIAEGGNEVKGFDMAPETRPEVVQAAAAAIPDQIPAGPFAPTWDSLKAHYKVPQWIVDAKFGLFMHFGLYAVPAHGNEWYEKHMYGTQATLDWHSAHFGYSDVFGYKDFIPKFTCDRFNADQWAELFKKSGAKYTHRPTSRQFLLVGQ